MTAPTNPPEPFEAGALDAERALQAGFAFARGTHFPRYNAVLGRYQARACLEHARGRSLLDLPCGDGLVTELFMPHFERVVGVDASPTHLAVARDRLPGVTFHEALIEELALDERFDTITMLNVLEHVQDPVRALQRAESHLAPGGVLLVHVPNANAINRQLAVKMGTLAALDELSPYDLAVAGHRRYYTLASLVADVEAAGLVVDATGGVFYKSLSTPQIDWLLEQGPWAEGGFGWGRVGAEQAKDWREAFCEASYLLGRERPEECNLVYVAASVKGPRAEAQPWP